MGCGGSKAVVPVENPNKVTTDVAITKFNENQEDDLLDDEKREDFFAKIKNVDLPQNAEESQINIRQKRKKRELKQGGFLKRLVNQIQEDEIEDEDDGAVLGQDDVEVTNPLEGGGDEDGDGDEDEG